MLTTTIPPRLPTETLRAYADRLRGYAAGWPVGSEQRDRAEAFADEAERLADKVGETPRR